MKILWIINKIAYSFSSIFSSAYLREPVFISCDSKLVVISSDWKRSMIFESVVDSLPLLAWLAWLAFAGFWLFGLRCPLHIRYHTIAPGRCARAVLYLCCFKLFSLFVRGSLRPQNQTEPHRTTTESITPSNSASSFARLSPSLTPKLWLKSLKNWMDWTLKQTQTAATQSITTNLPITHSLLMQ